MPRITTTHDIECGQTTCSARPGQWCRFLGFLAFTKEPRCLLFNGVNDTPPLFGPARLAEKDGRVLRCRLCLAAEEKNEMYLEGMLQ